MSGLPKAKIALIHVAKAQLRMAEEDYRSMLQRTAAVASSKELDPAGFERVMAELERLGFRNPRSVTQGAARPGMATPAQLGRIRALWKAYSGKYDDAALGRWLDKHAHTSDLRFLEGWRAGKVIAILEGRMVPHAKKRRASEAA